MANTLNIPDGSPAFIERVTKNIMDDFLQQYKHQMLQDTIAGRVKMRHLFKKMCFDLQNLIWECDEARVNIDRFSVLITTFVDSIRQIE